MAAKKQSLVTGALMLTVAGLVVKIIGWAYRIPLTATLGGDGMGFYSVAYNLYGPVYTLAVTGFPSATAKLTAQLSTEQRYNDVRRVRRVSYSLFALIGISGTLVIFALAKPFVNLVHNTPALFCVLAVAPSLMFSCLMSTHRGYSQGMRNMVPTALSQLVEVVCKTAFGLVGAYYFIARLTAEYESFGTVFGTVINNADDVEITILSYAAAGAIFGVTLSVFAGYLFCLIYDKIVGDGITKEMIHDSPLARSKSYYRREILRLGLPISLSAAVPSLTNLIDLTTIMNRLDSIIAKNPQALLASYGGLLDDKPLEQIANFIYGSYTACPVTLFNLIPSLTVSFGVGALPLISALWAVKDYSGIRQNVNTVLRMTTFIAAPIGIGMAMLAKPILTMVFPTSPLEVAITYPLLQSLGIAAIFLSLSSPIFSMLNALGRTDMPLKLAVVGGVIKILGNYFLVGIPSINIRATPYSTLACYLFIVLASLTFLARYAKIKIDYISCFAKPLIAAALCGCTALLCYVAVSSRLGNTLSTAVGIMAGGVAYIAASLVMKVLPREDVLGLPGGKRIAALLEKIGALK